MQAAVLSCAAAFAVRLCSQHACCHAPPACTAAGHDAQPAAVYRLAHLLPSGGLVAGPGGRPGEPRCVPGKHGRQWWAPAGCTPGPATMLALTTLAAASCPTLCAHPRMPLCCQRASKTPPHLPPRQTLPGAAAGPGPARRQLCSAAARGQTAALQLCTRVPGGGAQLSHMGHDCSVRLQLWSGTDHEQR